MKKITIEFRIPFTFQVKYHKDGWSAKCIEYDGIVTGGKDKNPSDDEVIEMMEDSIKTAFNI
ncbi:MAG: hypothetical protein M0R51_18015 [Clostridia bacterium]|jgi:hypothetical protein|nr:hypothetical protein [Clostridia bacterium]